MKYIRHINHSKKYIQSKTNKRSFLQNKKMFSIKLVAISMFILILTFVIIGFYKSNYFLVNDNSIIVNKTGFLINENDLKDFIKSNFSNTTLYNINNTNASNLLKENFMYIKDIEVTKKYPNTLVLNITERKPIFAIYNNDINEAYMVDEDGYIISKISKEYEFLFKVNYLDEIIENTYIQNKIFDTYTNLISQVDKFDLNIIKITFTNQNSVVYLDNNIKVLISYSKNVDNTFIIVDSIIKNTNDKKIDTIDLRFNKVIVSYL